MLNNMISEINQNVNIAEINHSRPLVIGMLLSCPNVSCQSIAEPLDISHDVIQKIKDAAPRSIEELKSFLRNLVKINSNKNNRGYLIGDDTSLAKTFANVLEGLGEIYDTLTERVIKGYKLVVICWTNQKVVIPVDFRFWFNEGNNQNIQKTKLELMQDLITQAKKNIDFNIVLLDGLYASSEMMDFFEKRNIYYFMRLPKNRRVSNTPTGIPFKIADNLDFKLKKNQRKKRFKAYFYNQLRFITASKRKKRNGDWETIYIISNKNVDPEKAINTYKIRWVIERLFRTSKQILGIAKCQSRKLNTQGLHVYACFVVYAILDSIKLKKRLKCVEDAFRYLQKAKQLNFCFEY